MFNNSELVGMSIGLYLILGYFTTRWVHKNVEPIPNLVVAMFGVLAWPIILVAVAVTERKIPGNSLINKLFGEGKQKTCDTQRKEV